MFQDSLIGTKIEDPGNATCNWVLVYDKFFERTCTVTEPQSSQFISCVGYLNLFNGFFCERRF